LGIRADLLLTLGLLAAAGCITTEQQLVPLYDEPTRLGADQVATLGGYVGWVDGRDVSKLGGAFELRPGCHVITTPTTSGGSTPTGATKITTSPTTFAVPMVAGRRYLVDIKEGMRGGPSFEVTVQVDEMDPTGEPIRSLQQATFAEIRACRQQPSPP
jgi:hypothetical protein